MGTDKLVEMNWAVKIFFWTSRNKPQKIYSVPKTFLFPSDGKTKNIFFLEHVPGAMGWGVTMGNGQGKARQGTCTARLRGDA